MSAKLDTVTADGLGKLLDQFHGSANLRALLGIYLDQIQALEDAAWPILGERSLDNATGHRLDGIGQIFNIDRNGRNDTDYRLAIKAQIAILLSTGTAEEILSIAQMLIQMATADYELVEYFPKTLYLRPIDHALLQDGIYVASSLRRAVAAATQFLFVYSVALDADTFQFSSTTGTETDAQTGFGAAPSLWATWHYESLGYTLSGLGSGEFRFNNVNPLLSTQMYVHDSPSTGGDQSATIANLTGDTLRLDNTGDFFMVYVTDVTDNTGTFTLDVVVTRYYGTIADYDLLSFYWYPSGGIFAGSA